MALNDSLIKNDNIMSVKKEIEYLICTKSKDGNCIILTNRIFNNILLAINEANKILSLIVTGQLLKDQTPETRAHIAKNMYIGKRVKVIKTLPIEVETKI